MTFRRILVAVTAVALPISPSAAQEPALGDTAKYSEVTNGTVVMRPPGGTVTVNSTHEADISVVFLNDGEAHAWYTALRLEQRGPTSVQRPVTEAILNVPYVLWFDDRGRTVTTSAPAIPTEIASMTDLTAQFDDFFITLPTASLRPGIVWADTVVDREAGRPNDFLDARRVRKYVVERDTVVAGTAAFIVVVEQDVRIEAGPDMAEQGAEVSSELAGTETGIAIVGAETGQLLARERSGHLSGQVTVTGGGQTVSFPQSYEYRSQIVLRP